MILTRIRLAVAPTGIFVRRDAVRPPSLKTSRILTFSQAGARSRRDRSGSPDVEGNYRDSGRGNLAGALKTQHTKRATSSGLGAGRAFRHLC